MPRSSRHPGRQRSRPAAPSSRHPGGSHELGQNHLRDRRVAATIAQLVREDTPAPVVELGAGDGALTEALVAAGCSVTAVELDQARVASLRRRFDGQTEVMHGDILTFGCGREPHHVVSNVPFGITTPLLRRLLGQPRWQTAVLLVQWEVARKRAGIGGTTMLTASWWPWYEFRLVQRVPAAAFTPRPSVDAGILVIRRRQEPLVRTVDRPSYQRLVRVVFTGTGRGLAGILRQYVPAAAVQRWLRAENLGARTLPKQLTAAQWASLYRVYREAGPRR